MIVRTIGLGAACLALVAESIMIPSTVTLPGLTAESVHRYQDETPKDEVVHALPIPDDLLEKFKDLHLGVSKPMPDFSDDADNIGSTAQVFKGDIPLIDLDFEDFSSDGWIFHDFSGESSDRDSDDWSGSHLMETFEHGGDDDTIFIMPVQDFNENVGGCPSGSSFDAIVCRVRTTLKSKIDQLKPYFSHHRHPCPKKLAEMAKAKADNVLHRPATSGGIPKFWPIFHPHEPMSGSAQPATPSHRHHHHHDHYRSKFSTVMHKICAGLRAFVTGFLIPVLIGVAAGMTASLLGMCVGTFLAWLWIKFVRGGKRGNASGRVMLDESDEFVAVKGEKEGLLEATTEEAPPTYVERE